MYLKYCAWGAPEKCHCAAKLRAGMPWREVVPENMQDYLSIQNLKG